MGNIVLSDKSAGHGEIVVYQPDDVTRLEVRVNDETVWLTQAQMASLFQTTPQNVTIHIRNIYKEGELEINPTCKDYLQVQYEGTRTVKRMQKIYNLEKFPAGYVIELTSEDVVCLRSNFSTLNRLGRGKHSKYLPKAFTEKGLYMLATGSMSHNGCAKVWRAVTVFWPKQSQLWLKSGN